MNNPTLSPLADKTVYCNQYNPDLLYPIPRQLGREQLGVDLHYPWHGQDVWNAYELAWLNPKGKPIHAIGQIIVPCNTYNLIESKSMKLYFNSLNGTKFNDVAAVKQTIQQDLSQATQGDVIVDLMPLADSNAKPFINLPGHCIDAIDIVVNDYVVNPQLLSCEKLIVTETLHSHLLKSNCPVTSQPDWGSVLLEYTGPKINQADLLRYIISYREHDEFAEQCVERMFYDVMTHCQPQALTVSLFYTRRGGLDINPIRSTQADYTAITDRLIRQ